MKPIERRILLNPGPATTSDGVKQALLIPDVCPREREFCDLYADVRRRLAALAGDPAEVAAIPLVGSGTAGLEAALVSFVPAAGLLLVLDNGDYGERLARIAKVHGLRHEIMAPGWGQPIDPAALEQRLDGDPRVTHVALVHHETSTGMLNPLEAILPIARRRGVRVIADAMSSFGALPLRVGGEGVDVLVSSANKCLQGMAGLAIVIATRASLEEARVHPPRSLYLDLPGEHEHLERTGQSRFTVPPQVVSALQRALVELAAEGLEGRRRRYDASMVALERGLRALGFEMLLAPGQQSRILLAVREPSEPWYDFDRMHDALLARGFTIYPGKAGRTPCFRLSVLGAIDAGDIERFLLALAEHVAAARAGIGPHPPA
jgi:2-aminoethylphosphonate-pyruvate transaminase